MIPGHAIAGADMEKDASVSASRPNTGWKWNLGLGTAYRQLGDIDFRSGSYSSTMPLPPFPGGSSAGIPRSVADLGVGPLGSFADRTYLDGFVFIDAQTANPSSFLPGTTGNWGYSSNAQVSNGSLTFSGGEFTTSSLQSSQLSSLSGWSDDLEGASPVLELEGLVSIRDDLSVGVFASFLFTDADTGRSSSNFSALQALTESKFSVTDRYDLQGVVPPLAPYSGSFVNPGTAPLIDNIPTERTILSSGSSVQNATFANAISESLRISLYTFSLGPSVHYTVDDFHFTGSMGLAVNISDVKSGYREQLDRTDASGTTGVGTWQADGKKTDIIPGFFIQAAAGYQFTPQWSASLFGRYDWSGSISGSVGPSTYSVDLGGYTLGAALTYTF